MSVEHVDSDLGHLFPEFREKLLLAFEHCRKGGLTMRVFEGYRSPARQLWLYEQGRSRPGKIVTGMRFPREHGAGVAADSYPVKNGTIVFAFTLKELHLWHEGMNLHDLRQTRFAGDYGHAELDCDEATRERALAWVARGFR